jgi:hypothetical protein
VEDGIGGWFPANLRDSAGLGGPLWCLTDSRADGEGRRAAGGDRRAFSDYGHWGLFLWVFDAEWVGPDRAMPANVKDPQRRCQPLGVD